MAKTRKPQPRSNSQLAVRRRLAKKSKGRRGVELRPASDGHTTGDKWLVSSAEHRRMMSEHDSRMRRRLAKKSKEACRSYAIYREGANRANQGMTQSMIVDIVKACSRKEAVEEVSSTVQVYANQYLRAVPRSRVPADEWNSFLEEEATWK